MNVERDIAGFALPFVAGVLITAYAGATFCAQSSLVHFTSLMVIFCSVMLLLQRRKHDFRPYIIWALISAGALGCGVLSAATAICLIDTPQSGLEAFCLNIGLGLQGMVDAIPFESEETSAMIKALLTGERGDLSTDIKNAFRDSGASHILALSGLHLGIIYGILSKTLALLGNSRTMRVVRSLVIICICGIYTLATGAGDSLVRALIFISLREIAKASCRYHGLGEILMASLIIQLVFDPLAIRSVSFQLSYAAMAGIAFVYPWLEGFWDRAASMNPVGQVTNEAGLMVNKGTRWIWNTAALSIACQLTTGPLAYIYFGTLPKYFIITNLLTLPLTGILIPTALLTLALSTLGCCPLFLVQITEWLTSSLIWMMEVISTID